MYGKNFSLQTKEEDAFRGRGDQLQQEAVRSSAPRVHGNIRTAGVPLGEGSRVRCPDSFLSDEFVVECDRFDRGRSVVSRCATQQEGKHHMEEQFTETIGAIAQALVVLSGEEQNPQRGGCGSCEDVRENVEKEGTQLQASMMSQHVENSCAIAPLVRDTEARVQVDDEMKCRVLELVKVQEERPMCSARCGCVIGVATCPRCDGSKTSYVDRNGYYVERVLPRAREVPSYIEFPVLAPRFRAVPPKGRESQHLERRVARPVEPQKWLATRGDVKSFPRPTPEGYTVANFRAWAAGELTRLRAQGRDGEPNRHVELLFNGNKHLTERGFRDALASAAIVPIRSAAAQRKDVTVPYVRHAACCYLIIGRNLIVTESDLLQREELFKRDKPIMRSCLDKIRSGDQDWRQLQPIVDQICARRKVSAEGDLIWTPVQEPDEEDVDYMERCFLCEKRAAESMVPEWPLELKVSQGERKRRSRQRRERAPVQPPTYQMGIFGEPYPLNRGVHNHNKAVAMCFGGLGAAVVGSIGVPFLAYAVVRHFACAYMSLPMAHMFAQNLSAIAVAPYAEEWCKRWSPGYTELITSSEFFLKLQVFGFIPAALGTVMHLTCARLPFHQAVALHTANNVLSAVELAVRVAWGPVTYQIAFSVDVNHHIPQLDALVALCSNESLQRNWKERMVQFAAFVAAFAVAETGMQRLFALGQYVATFPAFLVESLTSMVEAAKLRFQAFGDVEEGTDPVGTILGNAIRFLGGELLGLPATIVSQMQTIAWHTRFALLKTTGAALAAALLVGLQDLSVRISSAIAQRSWVPIFGPGRDPVALLRHLEFMRDNYASLIDVAGSSVASNKLREVLNNKHCPASLRDRVTPREFVSIATDIRNSLGQILPAVSSVAGHAIGGGLRRFDEWLTAVKLTVAGSAIRPVPFAIMLYGPPGVGKSVMAKELCAALLRSQDVELEDSAFYVWRSDSNFQDNLGFHTLVALFDDADQSAGTFALGTRVWSNDWIQLVGNTPYPVEKADVTQKGLYWCAPRICMMCTNFGGNGVEKLTRDPKAFYRRFDARIVVHPKASFSTPGGMLDSRGKDLYRTWDMYDLELMVFDDQQPLAPHARSVGTFSLPGLLEELVPLFLAHRARQMKLTSIPETERYCKKCFLDTTIRSCGHGPGWDGAVEWLEETARAFEAWPGFGPEPEPMTLWEALKQHVGQFPQQVPNVLPSQQTVVAVGSLAAIVGATAGLLAAVAALLRAMFPPPEEQMGQGVAQSALTDWGTASRALRRADVPPTQIPSAGQFEEVLRALNSTYVTVEVTLATGQTMSGRGSVVAPGIVLIPRHYVSYGPQLIVKDGDKRWMVASSDHFDYCGHREMVLLHIPGMPPMRANLRGHMFETNPATIVRFDEIRLKTAGSEHNDTLMNERCACTDPTWSAPFATIGGDCGSWWMAKYNGGWKLLGVHYGIYEQVGHAVCAVIERLALDNSVRACALAPESSALVLPALATVKGALVTPQLGDLSEKTNLGCALARFPAAVTGVTVFGTLPNCAGRSMRTKACPSLYHAATEDVEEILCGGKYWGFPQFKAFEETPGVWTSPVVNAFKTINNVVPDVDLMWAALFDYTSSFKGVAVPKQRLTEHEAYVGVPGSPFHVINTHTSVGPPFGGAKDHHMCMDDADDVRLSPMYHDLYRSIDDALGGAIPCAFANLVPKDEMRKIGKIPRIFCNLSAAYNVAMKQELAPVIAIMRDYPGVFESMVGIDMTSGKALEVPRLLSRTSGDLWDSDATALDKSWSPALYEFVALAFYSIAHCSGAVPLLVWRLIMGLRYAVYETNGDLLNAAWNPSGNMITVEMNGVLMSLCERYVCFRTFPHVRPSAAAVERFRAGFFDNPYGEESPFRGVTSLVTYGDDAAKRTKCLDPLTYTSVWKDELGIIVTDGSKGDAIVPKRLEDLVFLKRRFLTHPSFTRLVTPIDVRTLVRMLRYCKDSKLPLNTHALEVASSLARECAYHPDEVGDLLMREVNVHLKKIYAEVPAVYTVAYWRVRMEKDPSVSTWVSPENLAAEAATISLIRMVQDVQDGNSVPHVRASEVNSQVEGVSTRFPSPGGERITYQADETQTSAELNDIVLDTPEVVSGTVTSVVRQQRNDAPSLDKFMSRRVSLLSEVWSSTDTALTVTKLMQPLATYLANPNITAKLRNYSYMRGNFVITVVVAAAPGSYGLYAVSALPTDLSTGKRAGFNGTVPTINAVTQVDWHALVDVAVSTSIEIRLPYAGYFEVLPFSTFGASWTLYRSCFQSVSTSMASTLTTANVTYYGHFEEDYELAVPTYQIGVSAALAGASEAVSGFGHVASATSGVVSRVLGSAAEVARGLGYSRDNQEETPTHMMTQSTSSVVSYDGNDKGYVAALQTRNSLKGDDSFCLGIERDELQIADIVARKSLLFSGPLLTSAVAETILFTLPVHPGLSYSPLCLSTTAYVGLPFAYWRGDLDFWIYVPVSMFHRCRLQAVWSASPIPAGGTPANVTAATYSYVFDVVPGKMQKISIGYQMEKPYSSMCQTFNIAGAEGAMLDPYCNGWFSLRVVTPLTTLLTSDSTSVFVFMSGGENLQFAVPAASITVIPGSSGPPTSYDYMTVSYQSGVLGENNPMETVSVQLVPSPGASDPSYHFGESHTSIRAFMQKPSRSIVQMNANGGGVFLVEPLSAVPVSGAASSLGSFAWAQWYALAFFAFAGDETFHVLPNAPAWISASRTGYSQVWSVTATGAVSYVGPNLGYECVVPYYNPARFFSPCYSTGQGVTAINVAFTVDCPATQTTPLKMAVFSAVKSGFRMSGFCGCPGLLPEPSTVGTLFG